MKTRVWIAGAAIFAGLFFARDSSSALVEWKAADGGNGHFYEVVLFDIDDSWTSWDLAKLRAYDRGGYLATVTSAAENAFVISLIRNPDYWKYLPNPPHPRGYWDGPWIGGYQSSSSKEPAGGWKWITGEPMDYQGWHPRQPDDYAGMQNRLHYWGLATRDSDRFEPQWDDVYEYASSVPSFVVEYDDLVRVEIFRKSRRVFHRQNLTFGGVASARSGVSLVNVRLNGGPVRQAMGKRRWRIEVKLRRGRNRLFAMAVTADGRQSHPDRMTIWYIPRRK